MAAQPLFQPHDRQGRDPNRLLRTLHCIACIVFILPIASCDGCVSLDTNADEGPCASISCGTHETCLANDIGVSCICEDGYHRCDLGCVPETEACSLSNMDGGTPHLDAGSTSYFDAGEEFTDGGAFLDAGTTGDSGALSDSETGNDGGQIAEDGGHADGGILSLLELIILNPSPNQVYGLGETVQLNAQVTTPGNLPENLNWTWISNLAGELASGPLESTSAFTINSPPLASGDHTLTFQVSHGDDEVSAQVAIIVQDYAISVGPSCAYVLPNTPLTITASGAVEPLTFALIENNSGASINGATGAYTGGSLPWTTDRIQVTDQNGVTAFQSVQVYGQWSGSPLEVASCGIGDSCNVSRSYRVSSADYDFDQDEDFIVANIGTGYDRIFVNDGTGQFSISEPFPLQASREVQFVDYDLDRFYDVAFGGSDNSGSHLYENDPSLTFAEIFDWGDSSEDCLGMVTGDMNGDMYPEIICAHNQDIHPTELTMLINIDDGMGGRTFQQTYFFGNHMSQALSLADVDNDGDLDLAVGGSNLTATGTPVDNLLCLNDGTGNLTCSLHFGAGRTHEVEFGDFDGDHDADLLVSNHGEPLAIWWNESQENVSFVQDLTVFDPQGAQGGVRQFGVDDVDLDGDMDILVVGGSDESGYATLYMSQGSGEFCPIEVFTPQTALLNEDCPNCGVIMAAHFMDIDGEDWLDFVVTRYRHINEIWQTD